MGASDAVTFVGTKKVPEDSTATITFQLQDDQKVNVVKSNITAANLKVIDETDGTVLLTVADALSSYNTGGDFRYVVAATHNKIKSTATPRPKFENHVVLIVTDFSVGAETHKTTRNYRLTIQDNAHVA